jgi:type VI secretion system secreted protein VgrG
LPDAQRDVALSLTLGSGDEQLKPIRLDIQEGLSQPFAVVIDVIAKGEIPLLRSCGKEASIKCMIDGELLRHINGIVIDGTFISEEKGQGFVYRLTLAPKSHYHERGCFNRIFQNKTVMEIVKTTLERCQIDYKVEGSLGTRMLSYCVQYGESDFGFVSRLLEEEGIYYYYRHTADEHVLTMCDKSASHPQLRVSNLTYNPGSDSISIRDSDKRFRKSGAFIQSWQECASSGGEAKVTTRDFDFIKPANPVESIVEERGAHDGDRIEVSRFPGRAYEDGNGKRLAKILLESLRAQRVRYEVKSRYPGVQAGYMFTLREHPNDEYCGKKYLVIACRMQLADEQYRSGTQGGETFVEFSVIRDNVQFRAPQITPRPVVRGLETAVVTGKAGEEIHIDKYGRVKVKFHWDRETNKDETTTCFIRVAQYGALGSICHPRIGEEVLVDFINGNPDRPLVVGRVYNEAHLPIYEVPKHKTMMVMRGSTHKKNCFVQPGDAAKVEVDRDCIRGGNEIRLDDDTDNPQFFMYAEKDMKTVITNNEVHHVGKDVDIYVGKNRVEVVDENETITIKGARKEEVKKTETIKIIGDRSVEIKATDKLDVTRTIEIIAGTSITLKVGMSKIVIDQKGITLDGGMITVTGTGTAKMTSPMTTVNGDGTLIATGGIVKIN